MQTDNQLLEHYARHGSERAFRELVERHINLVHSAALRESKGDYGVAEDITQEVFTELARRSKQLIAHSSLPGWLYTCVRRMTANVRRADKRRQRRENEVFTMNELLGPAPADTLWQQVRPELDDVMHELNDEDRTAVVLRYFESRSLKEVGHALGLTENAARMRVERSLEKLHNLLSRRGVKSASSALATVLAAGAVMSAPASLASTVATGALTNIASEALASGGAGKLLQVAKTKAAVAGILAAVVVAVILWNQVWAHRAAAGLPRHNTSGDRMEALLATESVVEPAPILSSSTNQSGSLMVLQVVEAGTGAPLPKSKVHLAYVRQGGQVSVVKAMTGVDGCLAVAALEAPYHYLNLFVTAGGHVPKVTTFHPAPLPVLYTMALEQGTTVGGVVLDEAGEPIAGAKIEFDNLGNNAAADVNIQFGPDAAVFTSADGHWSSDLIPRDLDSISLLVTHPSHADTTGAVRPNASEATGTTLVMKNGFTVAGSVQDLNGNPIERARVREVRFETEGQRTQLTDQTGSFELKGIKAGEFVMVVEAKGFAPASRTLQLAGNLAFLDFQLGEGRLFRGHVVDDEGALVTNAWAETVNVPFRKLEWSTWVDRQGRFEWNSAPEESIPYSFVAEGFNMAYALELQADGTDHEIKLARSRPGKDTIQIAGTVVDADTGQPVDLFQVLVGEIRHDFVPHFRFETLGKEGKFTLRSSAASLGTSYQVQIEKEGYLPVLSTNLLVADGNQILGLKLQKGAGPVGVVLLPNGEPAINGRVFLCIPESAVSLDGPAHVAMHRNASRYHAQTDQTGRFWLAAGHNPQGIIVVHEEGYAEVSIADFSARGSIVLQPWGRVEGSLTLDSSPAQSETVIARSQRSGYDEKGHRVALMDFGFECKTDSTGRFTFEKVPPGVCLVAWEHQPVRAGVLGFSSHQNQVVVHAGAVTHVAVGGVGRPVVGRAVLPVGGDTVDWQRVPVCLHLKLLDDPGPYPQRQSFSTSEAFVEAMKHVDAANNARRTFGAFCDASGSFRLRDVPAGTYQLTIKLRDTRPNSIAPRVLTGGEPEIASLTREVVVTELPEGQPVEPLDLGEQDLVPIPGQNRASAR